MKKVINNKMYNTETAELVGEWDNGKYTNDFAYCSEDLYLKKTGEFFLHGVGNHLTKYNCREIIQPLSHVEAQEWAEEHLTGDEYEKIFGEISDDDSRVSLNLSLAADEAAIIKRRAQEEGMSVSAYVVLKCTE